MSFVLSEQRNILNLDATTAREINRKVRGEIKKHKSDVYEIST